MRTKKRRVNLSSKIRADVALAGLVFFLERGNVFFK